MNATTAALSVQEETDATVFLADGRVFIGRATYDGASISISGRERRTIYSPSDGEYRAEFGGQTSRTWPIGLVREIRWERRS